MPRDEFHARTQRDREVADAAFAFFWRGVWRGGRDRPFAKQRPGWFHVAQIFDVLSGLDGSPCVTPCSGLH